jgi:predicted nucleotidyltransferase
MSDRSIEKEDTTRATVRAGASVQRTEAGRRVPQDSIETVVRQIVEGFQPEQIILFGSYAYRRPGPESDVDLLVVMDTPLKEMEQAVRICQAIEYHFGLDLIVRTPVTVARRLALGDSFLHEATQNGKVLYERPRRDPHANPTMA